MYHAPLTKKIFDVLRFVVTQQLDVGVSEIARANGLSKGTTFGILAGLEKAGYISKNEATTKYSVGQELFHLSELIERRTNLSVIAKPYMERLSKKVNRTVFLGLKDEDKIRIEEVAEAKGLLTISTSIGTKLRLHAGAHGKAILSAMRDEEIAEWIAKQSLSGAKNGWGNERDIWSVIEEVRRDGYALDLTEEHTPGVWAVAMPIHYASCPTAIWVAGFKAVLNDKRLNNIINALRETVNDINLIVKTRSEEGYQKYSDKRIQDASQ